MLFKRLPTVSPLVALTLVMIGAPPVFAAETLLVEKLPYAHARDVLIDRGFKPYTMPGADDCEAGNNKCFPELERCVHKRHWICNYTWRNDKSIYYLETRAQKEEPPVVDSFYCLLNCGKDPDTNAIANAAALQQP